MEDQAGEVGKGDLCLGARDTDGADEQPSACFPTMLRITGTLQAPPICFFSRANTCSMRARTVDLAALACAVRAGIGLPLGLFAIDAADPAD